MLLYSSGSKNKCVEPDNQHIRLCQSCRPLQDKQPGEYVNLELVWDPEHPEYQLRWEENGLAYDIKAIGDGLTMEDIVHVAESMQ